MSMAQLHAAWGNRLRLAALVLALIAVGRTGTAASPVLILEATIPLDRVSGRIDHMTVDIAHRRLFVAELGNDSVDAIDLATRKFVGRIAGLDQPQGLAFAPEAQLVAVADAGDGMLSFFRAADLLPAGSLALGSDADNLHMDALGKRLIAGYGEGGLAVIDPGSRSRLADVRLPAHPEGFQLNRAGTLAFVNLPDAQRIGVVDFGAGRLSGSWPTPWASANFPMAIDGSDKMLAVGLRESSTLALIDAASGALLARVESCSDADDLFFDDRRQRIYESCGEGVVDVYELTGGRLARLARLPTSSGSRTSLFVPELDRLFVAERAPSPGAGARILIFRPTP